MMMQKYKIYLGSRFSRYRHRNYASGEIPSAVTSGGSPAPASTALSRASSERCGQSFCAAIPVNEKHFPLKIAQEADKFPHLVVILGQEVLRVRPHNLQSYRFH